MHTGLVVTSRARVKIPSWLGLSIRLKVGVGGTKLLPSKKRQRRSHNWSIEAKKIDDWRKDFTIQNILAL